MIDDLRVSGHSFFTSNRPAEHNPAGMDDVTGPAEEFDIDGMPTFGKAAKGEVFLKIGVGLLVKNTDASYYEFWRDYSVTNPGIRTVDMTKLPESITFTHKAGMPDGSYSYAYTRTLSLSADGTLSIRRTLENTGREPISTVHYSNNFIAFDNLPVNENYTISLNFKPGPEQPVPADFPVVIKDKEISFSSGNFVRPVYIRTLSSEHYTKDDNRFSVSHSNGMKISGSTDAVLKTFRLYADSRLTAPELFTPIHVQPGDSFTWTGEYKFETPHSKQ